MQPRRGLRGAARCGLIGALIPIILAVAFTVWNWIATRPESFEMREDLQRVASAMILPVIGLAVIFAATGWAMHAPHGTHGFARSLSIVVGLTFVLWFAVGSMLKYSVHNEGGLWLSPTRWMVLLGAPITSGAILAEIRAARFQSPSPRQS